MWNKLQRRLPAEETVHPHPHFLEWVRIYLGIGLVVKACYFMAHPEYLHELINRTNDLWFAPMAMGHLVVMAHLVGGTFLAIGFLTRLAALIQIPILLASIFYIYLPSIVSIEPRQNFEFAALVLFLLALFAYYGGGVWSVDNYLSRRWSTYLHRPDAKEQMAR